MVGGGLAVAQELRVASGGLVHGARLQWAVRLRRRQRRVPPAHRLQQLTSRCLRIHLSLVKPEKIVEAICPGGL